MQFPRLTRPGLSLNLDYLFLCLIAVASLIGINQYHYGMWNQFVSLPWLYDLLDPSLFPNDMLVEQRSASPSFFLNIIAWFSAFFGLSIARAHFILYILFLIPTIFSFYALGKSFFQNSKAGIMAAVLMSFAFPVIGDVQSWDSLLMERTMALPFLLFALSAFIRDRYWIMTLLLGVAFNLHPLSAIYLSFPLACALFYKEGFKWSYLRYGLAFLILAGPVLYLRSQSSSGESLFAFGEIWMEAMRLRNAHHAFPSAYPLFIWLKSAAILILFLVLSHFGPWTKKLRRSLYGFGSGILLLLLMGTIFTEWYPVKIIIQLQFFRSFLFLIFISLAMWSAVIFEKARPWYYLLFAFIVLQFVGADLAKLAGLLLCGVFTWFILTFNHHKVWSLTLIAGLFLALGAGAFYMRGGLKIDRGIQSQEWYDLQDWFAEKSAKDAMVIVPPTELGFRVRAKRSSYGDWFDGTKAFFSEEYARYWLDHMYSLDAYKPSNLKESYNGLLLEHVSRLGEQLAAKHSEVYIIRYADSEAYPLAESFWNDRYRVYRLYP